MKGEAEMTKRSVSRLYGLFLVVLAAVTIAASLVPDEAAADTVSGAAATDIVRLPRPSTTTSYVPPPVVPTTTTAPGFPFPPRFTTTTAAPTTTTTTSLAPPPPGRPIRPSPTTTTSTTTTSEGPAPEIEPRPDTEPVFFAMINQVREDAGRPALTLDEGLSAYARDWAEHLARTQVVEHSNFSDLIGTEWVNTGENIGFGGTPEWIIDWLIDSPPHYDTMTRSTYTHLGIGSWQDNRGLIWTVHVYAKERVVNLRPRP
jgi:uncharacterized protein YkwD